MQLKTNRRRQKYGHTWEWRGPNATMRGHWKSTEGNLVLVFPPHAPGLSWLVNVTDEELYEVAGNDAEDRAFCIAETYTRQERSTVIVEE